MTSRIHRWDDSGYKTLTEDGKIAFNQACCCSCTDCNCCNGLATIGSVKVQVATHGCLSSPINTNMALGAELEDVLIDGGSGCDDYFTITCVEQVGDLSGVAHITIEYDLYCSCACEYHYSEEFYVTCLPLNLNFVMPTDEGIQPPSEGCPGPNYCCGDISVTISSAGCSGLMYKADCMACHFCVDQALIATITAGGTDCESSIPTPVEVDLTFTSDCTWLSEVVCWGDSGTTCCYKLKLEGDELNNRWCDWYLTVYDASDTIIVNRLRATGAVADGLTITFPAMSIPGCCDGTLTVVITDTT